MAVKEKATRLADYKPAAFDVPDIHLHFDIQDENHVLITNRSQYVRSATPGAENPNEDLVLHGSKDHLALKSIRINGEALDESCYSINEETGYLTIHQVPDSFTLELQTEIDPKGNSQYSGLYTSEGIFCTQCESEGFRNMTYALDRPDVLSHFDVTIDADKVTLPHLLSNGTPLETSDLPDGRHRARWVDNRAKPPYLFALGAGDFDVVKGDYTYPDGEKVEFGYYVNKGDAEKATFALSCIRNALAHEYARWGHKYHSDSGIFNTIAVDTFVFGAMENTGLNIFNSKFVLANPKTATDADYAAIDSVINHEFCHDESGNWGIPRNWFQISFKEGLTVFRDQTYSEDNYGATACRIDDVQGLRGRVFAYDAGAMTHPMVLPSYEAVMNNYDALTYPKAAEINRMAEALVGKQAYRDAYRAFFDTTEPRTTTTEEYFRNLANHSGKNLDQFIDTWLNQPGVPALEVSGEYNSEAKTYALTVKQLLPKQATTAMRKAKPFHLPLKCGLVGADGYDIPMVSADADKPVRDDGVLEITKLQETFTFSNVKEKPLLSLNRDATAYATIQYGREQAPSRDDLAFLAVHDSNTFKRWDALQELGVGVLTDVLAAKKSGQTPVVDPKFIDAIRGVLEDESIEPGLKAKMLILPTQAYLKNLQPPGCVDPIAISETRDLVRQEIAIQLEDLFLHTYRTHQTSAPYTFSPEEMNRRSLMNASLTYLGLCPEGKHTNLVQDQFENADNFNDKDAALHILADSLDPVIRQAAFGRQYTDFKDDKLVMNKWLVAQAQAAGVTAKDITALAAAPSFDTTNPNKVRSLLGAFVANPLGFHATDGSGYKLIADWIIKLDATNHQVAGSLTSSAFSEIANYEPWRREQISEQVKRISKERGSDISPNVQEVITKTLGQSHDSGIQI